MLKINGLQKYYKSKEGLTHHALKGINLELGSKGFIVLLGKSGSGKSTLLNILGGLDNFDKGEINIKNKSTVDFKANEWDSYRNTYVGFVFQEFYIIEEYTVGKNIALALELQGYPKERIEERVAEILRQVDLDGYMNRRPNEISGGQKQRIAIARALVKDPQIILADEPTGNLDSETGKMILETLKKLSKEKLVIMVTHDADFAREYGDRIIELKDGEIISDQINHGQSVVTEEIYEVNGDFKSVIRLPKGKQLTQKMINYLNDLLLSEENDVYFSLTDDQEYIATIVPEVIKEANNESYYDVEEHLNSETDDTFELKKSSLPFRHAYKLAVSSLFTRKIRLVLMTFLFVVALMFVGIATNFVFYDISKASILTFEKANVNVIPLSKNEEVCNTYGDHEYCGPQEVSFDDEDIDQLKKDYQSIDFLKTINTGIAVHELIDVKNNGLNEPYYNFYQVNRINIIDENSSKFKLRFGEYPIKKSEILITDYLADAFIHFEAFDNITDMNDVLGKTLKGDLKITGIVQTDYTKYDHLKTEEDYNAFDKSNFNNERNTEYLIIYMTNQTYESLNFNVDFLGILEETGSLETGMISRGVYFYATTANESFEKYFLTPDSRLPINDTEIVLGVSALIEYHGYLFKNQEITPKEIIEYVGKDIFFKIHDIKDFVAYETIEKTYKIVGIYDNIGMFLTEPFQGQNNALFTPNELNYLYNTTSYNKNTIGVTALLGENSNENTRFIKNIDQLNYRHKTEYSYILYTLDEITTIFRNILYIVGGVISLFAAFMMFTFISTSISSKQKEIGTLRAVGARGIDVSKIFITESLIIAIFASVLANILTAVVVILVNNSITKNFEVPLVLLYVNILSILAVIGLAVIVVIISTYLPLKRITLMKPIKAIKNN
ncbi:MAG: transporter related protein [Haloplasmataceae bacterium]|jgi:ABC-type lipoprotein export system ATPase subunit/ABC-type lipoprotein release transport system permease subunit|nr:transporter related protein [Haloplasmataceae bacterium]